MTWTGTVTLKDGTVNHVRERDHTSADHLRRSVINQILVKGSWRVVAEGEAQRQSLNTPPQAHSASLSLPQLINQANAAIDLGECDQALIDSVEILNRKPDSGDGWNLRGRSAVCLGLNSAAKSDFQNAIRICPHYLGPYYNLASLASQEGDTKLAHRLDEQIVRITPDRVYGYAQRGEAYLDLGNEEKAMQEFQKLNDTRENIALRDWEEAKIYKQHGHLQKALALLTDGIKLDPKNAQFYVDRSYLEAEFANDIDYYDIANNPPPMLVAALRDANLAIAYGGGKVIGYDARRFAYEEMGAYKKAFMDAVTMINKRPNNEIAISAIARYAADLGYRKITYAILNQELRMDPHARWIWREAMNDKFVLGDNLQLSEFARHFVNTTSGSARDRRTYGVILLVNDQLDDALAQLRQSLKEQPDYSQTHNFIMLADTIKEIKWPLWQLPGKMSIALNAARYAQNDKSFNAVLARYFNQTATDDDVYASLAQIPAHTDRSDRCFAPFAVGMINYEKNNTFAAAAAFHRASSLLCAEMPSRSAAITMLARMK